MDQGQERQSTGAAVPATRVLYAVGGQRHGEQVEVAADALTWVDLIAAETYYVREFKYVRRDPANVRSMSLRTGWKAHALMHESIAADQQAAQQWWMGLALEKLFMAAGWEVPVSEIIPQAPPPSPNGRTDG